MIGLRVARAFAPPPGESIAQCDHGQPSVGSRGIARCQVTDHVRHPLTPPGPQQHRTQSACLPDRSIRSAPAVIDMTSATARRAQSARAVPVRRGCRRPARLDAVRRGAVPRRNRETAARRPAAATPGARRADQQPRRPERHPARRRAAQLSRRGPRGQPRPRLSRATRHRHVVPDATGRRTGTD